MKNIKETEALVKRYEMITLQEIQAEFQRHECSYFAKNLLTGFGNNETCTLCIAVDSWCYDCIYKSWTGCISYKNAKTFSAIENAQTPEELLEAYRNRAKHIKNILKKIK